MEEDVRYIISAFRDQRKVASRLSEVTFRYIAAILRFTFDMIAFVLTNMPILKHVRISPEDIIRIDASGQIRDKAGVGM